jgi:hypothetical protein
MHVRILDNVNQKGRPLLMVLTELGYVFANMHGAQNPDDGNPYKEGNLKKFNESMIRLNKQFLENSLEGFLECNGFSKDKRPTRIFIMGDFNDRYDAIEEFNIFGIRLRYNGVSPYSCCHNWDSSCSNDNFKGLKDFKDKKVSEPNSKKTVDHYYCEIPDEKEQFEFIDSKTKLKRPMPDEESKIEFYRYKGDKVFAEIDDDENEKSYGNIRIFDPAMTKKNADSSQSRKLKPSEESDHELVYAKFPYKSHTVYKLEGTIEDNANNADKADNVYKLEGTIADKANNVDKADNANISGSVSVLSPNLDNYPILHKYLVKNNIIWSKQIRNKRLKKIEEINTDEYRISFYDDKEDFNIQLSRDDLIHNFMRDPYDFTIQKKYTSTDPEINNKIKKCILTNVEGLDDTNTKFKFTFKCNGNTPYYDWDLDTIATLKQQQTGGTRRRKTRRLRKTRRPRPRKNNRKTRK